MTLARRLAAGLAEELRRPGTSPGDKAFRVVQRGLRSAGIAPHVDLNRCVIVELTAAPPATRGFADLVVRRGVERDVPAICAIDDTSPALVRARLARGDLAYVGQLDDEILCHTWFHPGPTPFDEERRIFTSWEVEASAFWSFHGVARADVRSSGVFAKLFQTALRELFQANGVRRVQGFIHHTNKPSLDMHERLGFSVLGTVTTFALPTHKWLRWRGAGKTRGWLLERDSDLVLPLPPR